MKLRVMPLTVGLVITAAAPLLVWSRQPPRSTHGQKMVIDGRPVF